MTNTTPFDENACNTSRPSPQPEGESSARVLQSAIVPHEYTPLHRTAFRVGLFAATRRNVFLHLVPLFYRNGNAVYFLPKKFTGNHVVCNHLILDAMPIIRSNRHMYSIQMDSVVVYQLPSSFLSAPSSAALHTQRITFLAIFSRRTHSLLTESMFSVFVSRNARIWISESSTSLLSKFTNR